MSSIPAEYSWLSREGGPKILTEALKLLGTREIKGEEHNPVIMSWAAEIGGWVKSFYVRDEIPWCGLFVGICALRAGFPHGQKVLSARDWLLWGDVVTVPALGDVLVFVRDGGGHVGLYVGEDAEAYHVLGGNQGDAVTIARLAKNRLLGARRCKWKISQPDNIRPVILKATGGLSKNEA